MTHTNSSKFINVSIYQIIIHTDSSKFIKLLGKCYQEEYVIKKNVENTLASGCHKEAA